MRSDNRHAGTFSDSLNVALDATLQKHLLRRMLHAALTPTTATLGAGEQQQRNVDVEEVRFNGKQIGTRWRRGYHDPGKTTPWHYHVETWSQHSALAMWTWSQCASHDAKIGTTTQTSSPWPTTSVSIKGTLDTTGVHQGGSTKFTVDATGNTSDWREDGVVTINGKIILLSEDAAVIKGWDRQSTLSSH